MVAAQVVNVISQMLVMDVECWAQCQSPYPSTQIVGFQGPKTIQGMDCVWDLKPTIWVLGPSG